MGIPVYYKNIINDFPDIIQPSSKMDQVINHIFFDLNCAIHPCCANKTNELEMFHSILNKINECILLTNVKDLIYIAIDGPAPRTKMEQQRQRRLKSSQENKIWDTNQITPGTDFMNRLNQFLKKEINHFKIKTILSDSNEPGEGEHKIMKFMDENIDPNSNNIIYGLDADLIMLSMIRKHKIELLRERTSFNLENTDDPYIYLDINQLKHYLINSINKPYYSISKDNLLKDYLFMCFLIGNDFIINTPSINIRYNGLDILMNTYQTLQQDYSGTFFIIENNKINIHNFKLLIQYLSEKEKGNIQKILTIRDKKEKYYHNKYGDILDELNIKSIQEFNTLNKDDPKITEEEYDSIQYILPLLFRENETEIFSTKKKYYTFTLYNHLDYNPSFDQILQKDIDKLCEDYIKSIQWTFSYYFDSCPSWRWYYKHHSAPLLEDIYNYISKKDMLPTFISDKPHEPEEQLEIVLPFQKENYMYPQKTPLFSIMKNYSWECHPILTHI